MVQKRSRKKSIKMRGKRTFGYGSHKKHRGGGSRGGRGMAGAENQKKTWFAKNDPEHMGKRGFKSLRQRGLEKNKTAVNVRDLERLAAKRKEIDLSSLGIDKVLGGGSIRAALTVKAGYFTESAKQKIEQAKGKAVLLGAAEEDAGKSAPEKQD